MDKVLNYLKIHVWSRERSNKDVALLNILAEREIYRNFMKDVPTSVLTDFVKDYSSLDRSWRKVTEENEDLRGSDYNDKIILSQNKQISLGYEVGYHDDIKLLSKIK